MVALVMRLVVGSCRVDEEHARGQMPTAPSRIDDMLAGWGSYNAGRPDGAVRLPRTCRRLSAMTTGLRAVFVTSKPVDPRNVFQLACKFASTETYIRNTNNPKAAFMASPSMVLAFAIELFLKCLLLLEGKEIDRIHTLNVLYRRLSHNRKRRIEEVWEKEARPKVGKLNRQFGFAHPTDLPNALVTCARAFEHLRYGYEDPDRQVFYLGELPTNPMAHHPRASAQWVEGP